MQSQNTWENLCRYTPNHSTSAILALLFLINGGQSLYWYLVFGDMSCSGNGLGSGIHTLGLRETRSERRVFSQLGINLECPEPFTRDISWLALHTLVCCRHLQETVKHERLPDLGKKYTLKPTTIWFTLTWKFSRIYWLGGEPATQPVLGLSTSIGFESKDQPFKTAKEVFSKVGCIQWHILQRAHFLGQEVWVGMKPFLIRIRCWAWGEPCWNTLVWRQMLLYHLQSKVAKKRGALLRSTDPEEPFLGVTECWCLSCFWLCLNPWQHLVLNHSMENCWDPWLDEGVKRNLVRTEVGGQPQ